MADLGDRLAAVDFCQKKKVAFETIPLSNLMYINGFNGFHPKNTPIILDVLSYIVDDDSFGECFQGIYNKG